MEKNSQEVNEAKADPAGRPEKIAARNARMNQNPDKPWQAIDSRRAAHAAKRGVKTKMKVKEAIASILFEGLVKAANKAKKNQVVDRASKDKMTGTPNANTEIARDMAGSARRAGKKATSKIWLKAAKGERMKSKAMEQIQTALILRFAKSLAEGRDDLKTDSDSISNAGGDSNVYAQLKAKKDAQLAKAVRNTRSRADTLGKTGGMYDKQGKPASKGGKTSGTAKPTKPMPLNPRRSATPRPGSNPGNARGKTVNTSRGDADSIQKKTDASDAIANKFYSELAKRNKS